MVRIQVQTALKRGTELLQYVTLHLRDRRGAASFDYRNRAEITILMWEPKPFPVRFSCWHKRCSEYCELESLRDIKQKKNRIELQGLIIRFSCFIALSQGA